MATGLSGHSAPPPKDRLPQPDGVRILLSGLLINLPFLTQSLEIPGYLSELQRFLAAEREHPAMRQAVPKQIQDPVLKGLVKVDKDIAA
jgi:hypothetical protein